MAAGLFHSYSLTIRHGVTTNAAYFYKMYDDGFLQKKLDERKAADALRTLRLPQGNIDLCSNDYMGIVKNGLLNVVPAALQTGSTGSRLLAGNYSLIEETEKFIAEFHNSDTALIFNSGYDANVGVLSSVPQKGDTVIYDALSHASIRDGIRLSFAQSFSFMHNDMSDLEKKLTQATGNTFVITESVFSMDGDLCPLKEIIYLCEKYKAHLILDEAHATGVIGDQGEGLAQHLNLHTKIFCRMHTFGKACGCHGAVVLGSQQLKEYLINFARSFIYSTALPAHSVALIKESYLVFPGMRQERKHLHKIISLFQAADIIHQKLPSQTPIQIVMIPGNTEARKVAESLQQAGLDVRAILYPTVPKEKERLRIVLHAFNTEEELEKLLPVLNKKP